MGGVLSSVGSRLRGNGSGVGVPAAAEKERRRGMRLWAGKDGVEGAGEMTDGIGWKGDVWAAKSLSLRFFEAPIIQRKMRTVRDTMARR